jgi:hypothetical protein
MRAAGDGRHGCRLRGEIVVLWRAGLRIHEALALNESDLDHRRGALLCAAARAGAAARSAWTSGPGSGLSRGTPSADLPVGPLFCVMAGPTRERPWPPPAVRVELHVAPSMRPPLAMKGAGR